MIIEGSIAHVRAVLVDLSWVELVNLGVSIDVGRQGYSILPFHAELALPAAEIR